MLEKPEMSEILICYIIRWAINISRGGLDFSALNLPWENSCFGAVHGTENRFHK